MLNFNIHIKPGIPIYEQVIYAVKKAIVTGQLKPGDPFPSVREISRELRINPVTVQKVITHLTQARLLEIHPGIGSVVSNIPEATDGERRKILVEDVERLIIETKRLNISKKELLDAIAQNWKLGKGD